MKIPVAILGATGAVGQRFIQLLDTHPDFEVAEVFASTRSAGKPFVEASNWKLNTPIPEKLSNLIVKPLSEYPESRLLFSGLDSSVAGDTESDLREKGYLIISNSKNHRMDADVPLVIPEINGNHLELVESQFKTYNGGAIVTNPNCSTIGLALALEPLRPFGITTVLVTTMQAISGAGFSGLASFDIHDNVVPFIGGEEDKIESEPLKIFGEFQKNKIVSASMVISAMVHRVNVLDGHMIAVSIKFRQTVSDEQLNLAFDAYSPPPILHDCPSFTYPTVIRSSLPDRPQTRLDRDAGNGMAITVGRVRKCSVLDWKFNTLSHNTIRGAAGGTILIAELMKRKGLIRL